MDQITVVWDGTARTSRTLDVISHAPEDVARYWLTRGGLGPVVEDDRPNVTPRVSTRNGAARPCRACDGMVSASDVVDGYRKCRACRRAGRPANRVRPVVTGPLPCRACKTGHVAVSRANQGERCCQRCLRALRKLNRMEVTDE